MNIHFRNGQHVETGKYYREYQPKGVSKDGTKPPRHREGQTYLGGRQLRRAEQRLYDRVNGSQNKGGAINWEPMKGYTKPGTMQCK